MPEMEEREQPAPQEQRGEHPMTSAPRPATASAVGDGDSPARDDAAIIKAGLAAVEEWEAEHGALSDEILAWADRVLDDALVSSKEPSNR